MTMEKNLDRAYHPSLIYSLLSYYIYPVMAFICVLLLDFIPSHNTAEIAMLGALKGLFIGIMSLVYLYKVLYLFTLTYRFNSDHIEIRKGLFTVQNDFIQYYRIKDIRRKRTFLSILIGTMEITLITSDKFNKYVVMKGISNDKFLANNLRERIERERRSNRVYEVD